MPCTNRLFLENPSLGSTLDTSGKAFMRFSVAYSLPSKNTPTEADNGLDLSNYRFQPVTDWIPAVHTDKVK